MPEAYHVLFGKQSSGFGTYDATSIAIPLDNIEINPGQEIIVRRLTGRGRAPADKVLGAKMVDGTLRSPLWNEHLGLWLRAAMLHDITSTQQGATTAYEHGFLPDDAAGLPYMSLEKQLTSTEVQFVRSAILDTLSFTFANKEIAEVSGSFLGEDETKDNDFWSDGVTASPAITGSPTYPIVTPFTFFDLEVSLGGTVSLDAGGFLDVSGGTADTSIESASVEITNSLEHVHTATRKRTPSAFSAGPRDVTITLDDDWTTINLGFYDALRDGTEQALRITATSSLLAGVGFAYTFELVFPLVYVESAPWSPATGEIEKRTNAVTLKPLYDPTTGYDMSVRIIDKQTSY